MRATVNWLGKMAFQGESGSGHQLRVDGPQELGGEDSGSRPMELLLIGLGSCSAVDVVHILQRGRQDVTDCSVEVIAERAEHPPRVFTQVHLHFRVAGHGLRDAVVRRAVGLSAEKYCSASLMLAKAVDISHDYEIVAG